MTPTLLLTTAFLIAHALSVGTNPEGAQAKLIAWLLGCFAYLITRHVPGRWARWWAVGVGVALAFSVVATLGETPERNTVAGALAMLAPLAWYISPAVLLTGSRGATLAAIVALFLRHRSKQTTAQTVALVILAIVTLGVWLYALRPETVDVRFYHWHEAFIYWTQEPWLGWGLGEFSKLGANGYGAHANGLLFTLLAETGLFGVFFVGLVFVKALQVARVSSLPARYGLVAFALHQLFDDTFFWPLTIICAGVLVAMCEGDRNEL